VRITFYRELMVLGLVGVMLFSARQLISFAGESLNRQSADGTVRRSEAKPIARYTDYTLENFSLRAHFNSIIIATLTLHLVQLARRIDRDEDSQNALWIARGYLLVASAFIFHPRM
jgi:hypothetical protein